MKKLTLVIFLFFLFVIPFASAEAPITEISLTAETPAITIVYPKCDVIKKDNNRLLPFDILNSSYGRLNNDKADCSFFLVNDLGLEITSGNLTYDSSLMYWKYNLNTTHTENEGCFSFYVHCNSSEGEFGFVSEKIKIKKNGEQIQEYNNFSFLIPTIVLIMVGILFVTLLFRTNKMYLKVIYSLTIEFIVMVLLRFNAWFIEITNPSEEVLIKSLNFWYSLGIKLFYFSIIAGLIFLIILSINAVNQAKKRKVKDSWEKWGDED